MLTDLLLDYNTLAPASKDEITLLLNISAPLPEVETTRAPQALQFVLDRSGSMAGQRLETAKTALLRLLDRLSPSDAFGLVLFDNNSETLIPLKPIKDHNLTQLRSTIKSITAGNSTDINSGFILGAQSLLKFENTSGSTLILLSDGHANAGQRDPEILKASAASFLQNSITTSTIGIGEGYDELLLSALSTGGAGTHRFASNSDELSSAIADEITNLLQKSAIATTLTFNPDPSLASKLTFNTLQHFTKLQDSSSLPSFQLGDLYAGESRDLLFSLQISDLSLETPTTIASLDLSYFDPSLNKNKSLSLPILISPPTSTPRVANPIVQAHKVINQAQSQKAQASALLREGSKDQALKKLNKALKELTSFLNSLTPTLSENDTIKSLLEAEINDIKLLIEITLSFDTYYSAKRLNESYSRKLTARDRFRANQKQV